MVTFLGTTTKLLSVGPSYYWDGRPSSHGQTPQYFTKPTRRTQPPTLSGMGNEYQPKCGDALQLGSKDRYGSFHLWISVWVAGKTVWSPLTCAIAERLRGKLPLIRRTKIRLTLLVYFTFAVGQPCWWMTTTELSAYIMLKFQQRGVRLRDVKRQSFFRRVFNACHHLLAWLGRRRPERNAGARRNFQPRRFREIFSAFDGKLRQRHTNISLMAILEVNLVNRLVCWFIWLEREPSTIHGTSVFTGCKPFMSHNKQHQSTEEKKWEVHRQ